MGFRRFGQPFPRFGEALGQGVNSGISFVTYLRDQFITAHSAPLTSPRTCELGPGTLVIVDTNNKMSISGQKMIALSGGLSIVDPGFISSVSYARVCGLFTALTMNSGPANNIEYMGFSGTASLANQLWRIATTLVGPYFVVDDAGVFIGGVADVAAGIDYRCVLILRTTGAWFCVKGGEYSDWTRFWVSNVNTGANNWASYHHGTTSVSGVGVQDEIVGKLPAPLNAQYGDAFFYKATTVNSDTFTTPAHALIEHTITAATGVTQEIMLRKTDDNNCWIIRMSQAGSTIKLIEKTAGVETEQSSVAQTWTNNTAYRVVIRMYANCFKVFVAGVFKFSYASYTNFNVGVAGGSVSNAGTELVVWPNFVALPMSGPSLPFSVMGFGDSKTYGAADTTPPITGKGGYIPPLVAALATATGNQWGESPLRIGHSAYTVTMLRNAIDADLANAYGTPTHILCNVGVNDLALDQATFIANYGYCLDALHQKYAGAKIGLMRVWMRGADPTALANMDNIWIPALISARPGYCFTGPDERIFLENGDNGVTYTTDGTHPNHAGYALTATQWKTAMGF